jgi:hypothetical protein
MYLETRISMVSIGSPIKTDVPTLFVSGVLDNNTQPFQADDVRKTFKNSTHLVIDNGGQESMPPLVAPTDFSVLHDS